MPTPSGRVLVLGDYPVGYANGIGETLSNLLVHQPDGDLFQAHPAHLHALNGDARGRAVPFTVPRRPSSWPARLGQLYQPILKLQQFAAERQLFESASTVISEQQIDAVLTYPVTPWVLFAAVKLRRQFPRVRFVFYVMDDWQGHHTCFGLPFTPHRRAALAEMVATADVRFACSHLMKRDYERRYNNDWNVLHKGIDPSTLPAAPGRWRFSNILYTGAMNMFRFDAVLAFAEGMRRYREQSGRDLTLTMLGPTPDREYASALAPYDFIRTDPWVDNAACQCRMAEADVLYLPLSFEARLDRIANLAMPTKLSEYLASGRPTIFHVPAQSEVRALVSGAGLPLTLHTTDPNAIRDFLMRVGDGGVDMAAYQKQACALLRQEFDQTVLRDRLRHALFGSAPS